MGRIAILSLAVVLLRSDCWTQAPTQCACQAEKLTAADGTPSDSLGGYLAGTGETVIAGAYLAGTEGSGAAYVFTRLGQGWVEQKLEAFDPLSFSVSPTERENFGKSVATDGVRLVVGADGDFPNVKGRAYVFERVGTSWLPQGVLEPPPEIGGDDGFGSAVDINGDLAVVGAIGFNSDDGAAYVYRFDGTTWGTPEQMFHSSSPGSADTFGSDVSVEGDWLAIGASSDNDGGGLNAGTVSLYEYNALLSSWDLKETLSPLGVVSPLGAYFGAEVVLRGDELVVGAFRYFAQKLPGQPQTGLVFVYCLDGGSWLTNAPAVLEPPDGQPVDEFGGAVEFRGDHIAVGAGDNCDPVNGPGAVYVFSRVPAGQAGPCGDSWDLLCKLEAADADPGDCFGSGVTIDYPFVGAGAQDDGQSGAKAGAAYAYNISADQGAWANLGMGLAPIVGQAPTLVGKGALLGGCKVTLEVGDAEPFTPAFLVIGLSALNVPFKGGTLVPFPGLVLPIPTATGDFSLEGKWPYAMPAGTMIWIQYWVMGSGGPEGWTATNAMTATAP